MTEPDLLTRTTEVVDKLHALLHDPQPGLITWHGFVVQRLTELRELSEPLTVEKVREALGRAVAELGYIDISDMDYWGPVDPANDKGDCGCNPNDVAIQLHKALLK